MNRDYYFTGNSVQIQGRSSLPPALNAEKKFLNLTERRNLCTGEALMKSHAKWLSLTFEDRQDPEEWRKRLELGAVGPWSSCLKSAKILNSFYDDIHTCRIVVLYGCHPSDY